MPITLQNSTPAQLHHLHIGSPQADALADFYQRQFTLHASRNGELHVLRGGTRNVTIASREQAALLHAGYALRNAAELDQLAARLQRNGASLEMADVVLFAPGAFLVADPQGRKLAFGVPLSAPGADARAARLQHTVFQTTELEAMVRFYVETIGFAISDEVVDVDGTVMVVFLRSDDEHHSLAFFRGSQNEWDHHCYETGAWNDIRDWGDQFARQRIPIFFGPGRHGPGNNLFFMVTDPDGNRLEFSAELERVAAEQIPGVWPHGEYTLNSWGRAWIRS
ncbi:MAG: VOC family protein [Pseudomonadota bacterium]